MLKKLILENFKPVHDRLELNLQPITVLSGLNSSGKTSVLQVIRLLSQTLSNQVLDSPLILNGFGVQMGDLQSIRNDQRPNAPITIGFELELKGSRRRGPVRHYRPAGLARYWERQPLDINVVSSFGSASSKEDVGLEAVRVVLQQTEMSVLTTLLTPNRLVSDPTARNIQADSVELKVEVRQLSDKEYQSSTADLAPEFLRLVPYPNGTNYRATFQGNSKGRNFTANFVRLSHFLPAATFRKFDLEKRRQEEWSESVNTVIAFYMLGSHKLPQSFLEDEVKKLVDTSAPPDELILQLSEALKRQGFRRKFRGTSYVDLLLWCRKAIEDAKKQAKSLVLQRELVTVLERHLLLNIRAAEAASRQSGLEVLRDLYADIADEAVQAVTSYFTRNVRYLGPLRAEPHLAHGFSPSNEPDDVGSRGEYASAVYEAHRKRPITWWNPETQESETAPLAKAVDTWARYIGVAHEVSTQDAGQSGVAWVVRPRHGSGKRRLSEVGVGVSQLLPILVAGLLAPENALLLIEQPELHLHPRAQARLADFFLGQALVGKQCIVETHSDALINQFRYQIVSRDDNVASQLAIYFVHQDDNGFAEFQTVEVSRTGMIVNWPDGFFDESLILEDRIAGEAIKRRARKRES